jgi:ATP-binding cassette subfamily B protein
MGLLKHFITYYRPHLKIFIADMITSLIIAGLTILVPYFVFKILNDALPASDLRMIVIYLLAIAVLTTLISIADYINIKWGHILGVRMEADMRRDLFCHLQKLSFSYFDRTKTGHIMSRISNDLTKISEAAHHGPEDLLISFCTMAGAFAFMFCMNPLLAAITIVPLPLIIAWGGFNQRRLKEGFRQVRKKVADINSRVENSIQGIREVKSYNNEEHEIEKFHEVNVKFKNARENVFGALALFHSGIMFMIKGYDILFIGAGALLIYYQKATIAEVVAFYMYNRYIVMPIFRMVHFTEQFQEGITAFERFHEIINEEPDIKDRQNALSPAQINGDIELKNVFFKYSQEQEEEWILDDVSMHIPSGCTAALVGESGAGKSTLAALVPRFYEVNEGTVKIDGNDILDLQQRVLRANVGIVQQTPFLFDTTIRENILFGKPDATEEELINAARNANILDFIESLADGFDTQVGEHGVKLSGGQKQRISIARVFLKNPPILIFDEATSSLDNESEALIQSAMEKLCKGRTTIIIAHRLSTVRNADFIYVLRNGKIVEEGKHEELLDNKGYYFKLYSMHNF